MANNHVTANANRGGPAITVEVEQSANHISYNDQLTRGLLSNATVSLLTRREKASPFQHYRSWNKVLSVSDLVSPAWCELQFDYGLRQKRSRKLENRPASFTSAEGKVISVEKNVAAKNDRKIQRGRSVHKILEKEIRPEEVRVPISFEEERWALRLVNMLSGIHTLITLGCTREMPVFGIVRGQIVVGVIDELLRKPVPVPAPDVDVGPSNCVKRTSESSHATPKSKRTRRPPSPSQPDITSFFPTFPENAGLVSSPDDRPSTPPHIVSELVPTPTPRPTLQAPLPSHQFTLHLLDTKTRHVRSLPDDVDTICSRLQLMLYHRLLSSLIFPDSVDQLNFGAFWTRLGMNPRATFSTSFKNQAGVLLLGNNIKFNCLDDLTRLLREQVRDLDVPGVDERLQLIYRTQPKGTRKGKGKGKSEFADKAVDVLLSREDLDMARAIEESLKSTTGELVGAAEHKFAVEVAKSLKQSQSCVAGPSNEGSRDLDILTSLAEGNGLADDLVDDPELQWVLQESLLDQAKQAYGQETTDEESSEPTSPVLGIVEEAIITPPEKSIIIGTKEFSLDDRFLDGHLTNVLQWWHGQRAPQGVEVALSRRCFTCEYIKGCEWREMKANEAAMALKRRQAFKGGQ
ncbi:hypothetical protein PILCRDRAFT_813929 [Piloderma croceum F 1598]|uniref:Exonuclease V n=1 Tax=Piloderma croceum (strain F 1598) TaxID=765440 RepID=A0A0C3FXC8_PILCF|nr:hypothetical protein PILCRDRAFT_813929 [Piloderma croceum F 1598]